MKPKSKTSRIIRSKELILSAICSYATLAADWDPRAEGDFESFSEALTELLEELVE